MTLDETVRFIADRIAALAIVYRRGVTQIPDPDYERAKDAYDANVRAEPYRKRQPPPSPTMASYERDGVSKSAAVHWPGSRIGDHYCESSLHGPETDSVAALGDAIAQIISDARLAQD